MLDALLKAKDFAGDGQDERLRSLLGALASADWKQALIARGFGYHFTVGTLSTGVTGGGAGTVLDIDEPEVAINIPRGVAVIPLRIDVQCNPVTTTVTDLDENEILIAADRGTPGSSAGFADPASGATVATVVNMRTDKGIAGCPARCYHTVTTALNRDEGVIGTSDPVESVMELARYTETLDSQTAVGIVRNANIRLLYEPLHPPILVGGAALYIHWGGTVALTGFAQVQFLALPSSLFTRLE